MRLLRGIELRSVQELMKQAEPERRASTGQGTTGGTIGAAMDAEQLDHTVLNVNSHNDQLVKSIFNG